MLSTVLSPSGLFSLKRSGSDDAAVSAFFLASPSPAPAASILGNQHLLVPASSSASSSSLFSPLHMHAFAQQPEASSTPMMMMQPSSSPVPMDDAQSDSHAPTLRFTAGPSAASSSIGAFNFAATVKQPEFIVDVPVTMLQRATSAPHHNPEFLEGFLLDGGCAATTATAMAPSSAEGKRKRKETSSAPSSASSADTLSIDSSSSSCVSKKARRHGTSLNDSRSSSPSVSSSSAAETLAQKSSTGANGGSTSPLLELLQQSNQSMTVETGSKVKASKKERAELRRHKAAMKLLRLEASIARLTAEVSSTKAQELAATQLADHMARQAAEAAQFASLHVAAAAAQRQEEVAMGRMIDSFLINDSSSSSSSEETATHSCADATGSDLSLPPLSPVARTASLLRVGVPASSSASLSSASVSDDVDLSECSTPTDAVSSRVLGSSVVSPVHSLDEAIEAALLQAQSAASGSASDRDEIVAHVQGLAWAEQARSIRHVQHALSASLDAHSSAAACFGSVELALRFAESTAGACCGASSSSVRSSLALLHADVCSDDEAAEVELQHSLRDFTAAFLAKQRANAAALSHTHMQA